MIEVGSVVGLGTVGLCIEANLDQIILLQNLLAALSHKHNNKLDSRL